MSDTTNRAGADAGSDIGHVFDQTNGVAEGYEGESDGTAAGDTTTAADRDTDVPTESEADTGDAAVMTDGPESVERTPDDPTDTPVTAAEEFSVDEQGTATAVGGSDADPTSSSGDPTARATAVDPSTSRSDSSPDDSSPRDDSQGSSDGTSVAQASVVESGDSQPATGLGALDDGSIGHVFDQTNGVIEGLDGDSDGSAESDTESAAERADDDPGFVDAAVSGNDEGVADLDRRNP